MKATWHKLDDGAWGVRLSGNLGEAADRTGEVVDVTTRAGTTSQVTLGRQVAQWNGGRSAVYTDAAQQQDRRPVPAEGRSLTDREVQRLLSCISVYVCETDGDAEIIEIENKLRGFIGREPVDLPDYMRSR